jgi:hypothetical protein
MLHPLKFLNAVLVATGQNLPRVPYLVVLENPASPVLFYSNFGEFGYPKTQHRPTIHQIVKSRPASNKSVNLCIMDITLPAFVIIPPGLMVLTKIVSVVYRFFVAWVNWLLA